LDNESRETDVEPRNVEPREFLIFADVIGDGTLLLISWRGSPPNGADGADAEDAAFATSSLLPICALLFANGVPLVALPCLPLNLGGVGRTAGPPHVGGGIPSEEIQISDLLLSRVFTMFKNAW